MASRPAPDGPLARARASPAFAWTQRYRRPARTPTDRLGPHRDSRKRPAAASTQQLAPRPADLVDLVERPAVVERERRGGDRAAGRRNDLVARGRRGVRAGRVDGPLRHVVGALALGDGG